MHNGFVVTMKVVAQRKAAPRVRRYSLGKRCLVHEASSKSNQVYLSKKKDICPAEKDEEEVAEEEEGSSTTPFSPRSIGARLCDLHRSQASWKKWGTSCKGEYCDGHEWPSERDARCYI